MANEDAYNSNNTDNYAYQDGLGYSYGTAAVGHTPSLGGISGAIRFPSIPINQGVSVNYALLYFYAQNSSGGSGTLKAKIYGINQDNTAIFNDDVLARPRTTAVTTFADTVAAAGTYEDWVVTSQVNEILARPGWASGNAMGFHITDDTTADTTWISDPASGAETYLLIRVNAEPNFFPTPGSVAAPTFPAVSRQGLKISLPGYDVRQATESQLLLTTRKKEFKIVGEGNVDCVANVLKTVAHGLPSAPACLGYVESGGYRLKLNRDFLSATDPITGGAQGHLSADSSNIRIMVDQNKNVYYYIFIDPLNES